MAEPKAPPSLIRPSLNTQFHIDYSWWDRSGRDLEVYLRSHLCEDHQQTYGTIDSSQVVDFVDPVTAEVTRVDGMRHILMSHCSQQSGYLTAQTSLVNAVFRVFLANHNAPLTPGELEEHTGRKAGVILRTLSGSRVYKGIRPVQEV
jgi:hypothetical protein